MKLSRPATNREKISARERAYRAANWEKIAAREHAYRAANREKIAARKHAYRAANREAMIMLAKQRVASDPMRHWQRAPGHD